MGPHSAPRVASRKLASDLWSLQAPFPAEDPVSDLLGDGAGELDTGEGCEEDPMDQQLSEA